MSPAVALGIMILTSGVLRALKTGEIVAQKFCNRATKAFVALAHQMPSSFRNSWSRFTDSVLQRLIPRGVITEVVFTQSNHSRT